MMATIQQSGKVLHAVLQLYPGSVNDNNRNDCRVSPQIIKR
jgi:hypothetical protein